MPILIFPAGDILDSKKNLSPTRKNAGDLQRAWDAQHGLQPRSKDVTARYREETERICICAADTVQWVDAPELGYVAPDVPLKRKLIISGKETEDLQRQQVVVDGSLGFSVAQIKPDFSFGNGCSVLKLTLTSGQQVFVAVIVVDPADVAQTPQGWQALATVAQA